MPTYSYRCANCDHAFDQYQAFTDDSLTVCPNCGQPQLRKVFNSIGVTFNGSGFYHSDSGSGSGSGSKGADKGSESGSDTSPGKGSDGGSGTTESTKAEPTKAESTPKAEPKKAEPKKAGPASASS